MCTVYSCYPLSSWCHQVLHELVRLDEQELSNKYKVGVIYCKEGQETEEDFYNNGEHYMSQWWGRHPHISISTYLCANNVLAHIIISFRVW